MAETTELRLTDPFAAETGGRESAYCSEDESCCCAGGEEAEEEGGRTTLREIEVDVAIIGNGPSAIFLSLLLSGYRPYFSGEHPNPILKERLKESPLSLLEQDLQYLSEGLEGRSKNPVSLLFDSLFHPNADTSERHPPSIEWTYDHTSPRCSHAVLGRGKAGGVWHCMEQSLLTLSLQEWLDLPIYSFKEWKTEETKRKEHSKTKGESTVRAAAGEVAQYYKSYIEKMKLSKSFFEGMIVNKVEPSCGDCPSVNTPTEGGIPLGEVAVPMSPPATVGISSEGGVTHSQRCCCDRGVSCPAIVQAGSGWKVNARSCCRLSTAGLKSESQLVIRARKLVLACGLSRPKRLNVPGEEFSFVLHDMTQLRAACRHLKATGRPVLVIGAGMTAADSILLALRHKINVFHAFYQDLDGAFIFDKLPNGLYKEYHRVWHLMQGLETSPYYTPLKQHRVKEFLSDSRCVLINRGGVSHTLSVSAAVVMVGSQANLDFLPEEIRSALAMESNQPIDSKHNTIDVDLYTSQSERFPNLYALGPLVGDHFVRFLFGSGLACAKSILYS